MISVRGLFSFFVANQAQKPRGKEASKAADELVSKPEFLNRCRERLISTMIRAARSLTIVVSHDGEELTATATVTPEGGLVRLITDVIHNACLDLPDSVLEAGRDSVEGQVQTVIARKLASNLGQYFADNQRIPLAVARHEALKAPHLVVGVDDLKSFLDKKLQKNADVLFDDLYTFDTTSTYRKGD